MPKNYLFLKRNIWSFRIRVPYDLQAVIRRKELKYSLKTGSIRDAKRRADKVSDFIQSLYGKIRKDIFMNKLELTPVKIREIVTGHIKRIMADEIEDILTRPLDRDTLYDYGQSDDPRIVGLDVGINETREALHLGELDQAERPLEVTCDHLNLDLDDVDKNSLAYRLLLKEVLRGTLKALQGCIEMRNNPEASMLNIMNKTISNFIEQAPLPSTVNQTSAAPEETPKAGPLLSEVIEAHKAENLKAGNWKPRTITEYENCANLLIKALGDIPITTVSPKTVREYKVKLQVLPCYMNSRQLQGKTLDQITSLSKDMKKMSVKTINKYLGFLKGLFNWAKENNYLESNPAEGLRIFQKKRGVKASEERSVFSRDDIEVIFWADNYLNVSSRRNKSGAYKFWLPLLGLYTGARIEEICQLSLDDIKHKGDIWVIDINETGDKGLKTAASKRIVPLHPFLIDTMNFPEFVKRLKKAGHDRLFPELEKVSDRYSHYASRWFGDYLRKRCGITEKGKSFHSFRHTVINYLKQSDIETSKIKQFVGHSDNDMTTGRYGKQYPPEKIYQDVTLKLEFGIDLKHLVGSPYVMES
jgi:integrase